MLLVVKFRKYFHARPEREWVRLVVHGVSLRVVWSRS